VPVPGSSRSIPLYLLAPGAYRGPRAVVACVAMVFGSMVATSATAWAVVAQALAGQDGTVAGRLAVVAIVLWVAALFVADFAWIRRPRTRPLNSDLARW
jgi:apolipoprotein N-acyltransferase